MLPSDIILLAFHHHKIEREKHLGKSEKTGYYKHQPDLSCSLGDLGRRDVDGYFWIVGRADDIVVYNM